jgi:hypothetical protein
MRRIAFYLLIAAATFTIGSALARHFISFKVTVYASGERGGGVGYKSSDGVELFKTSRGFDSTCQAADELNALLKRAERVIERAPKLDKSGRVVGERVVAVFHLDEPFWQGAAVIWTDEKLLSCIESSSLRHVLKLEGVLSEED